MSEDQPHLRVKLAANGELMPKRESKRRKAHRRKATGRGANWERCPLCNHLMQQDHYMSDEGLRCRRCNRHPKESF